MKIALLKSQLTRWGGLEKYSIKIAQAFAAKGCQVTLLTTGELPAQPIAEGVESLSLGPTRRLSLLQLLSFDRWAQAWIQKHRPPIVFGLERNSYQTHYRAGNGVHATYLMQRRLTDSAFKWWSLRWNPLHQLILHLEKKSFQDPALRSLYTNSEMVRGEILQRYAIDPAKVHAIHNGVEWHQWQSHFEGWQSARQEQIAAAGYDPSAYQLLFAGHGFARKGLGHLLRGLALLKNRHWQLTVAGRDRRAADFQRLAEQLGLQHQVRFIGESKGMVKLYQFADALAIPSIYDPFANVTIEALAMGLQVVTSRFNGAQEILTPATGIVVEELASPDSMAQALTELLERPKNPLRALATRESVHHLDFAQQLDKLVTHTLQSYA